MIRRSLDGVYFGNGLYWNPKLFPIIDVELCLQVQQIVEMESTPVTAFDYEGFYWLPGAVAMVTVLQVLEWEKCVEKS